MKKLKEVLPLYREVIKGSKGWSVKSYATKGYVKHIGRYKTQKAANKVHEALIIKTK